MTAWQPRRGERVIAVLPDGHEIEGEYDYYSAPINLTVLPVYIVTVDADHRETVSVRTVKPLPVTEPTTARSEVEQLRAENRELFKRLSDQERFNAESRRSICTQSDGYKAERDELRAMQAEHDLLTVSGVEDLANKLARTEDAVERLKAELGEWQREALGKRLALGTLRTERDALSARLQAVRDLPQQMLNTIDPARDGFAVRMDCVAAVRAALDAPPGTPGDEKPQPREPKSMRWRVPGDDLISSLDDVAARIVAWVNSNSGEARCESAVLRRYCYRIAIRTATGWDYAKPGDRIVMGDTTFPAPGSVNVITRHLREFTVSPVEPSGGAK